MSAQIVQVENKEDERLGGWNKCGRKFVEYWKSAERGSEQCKNNKETSKHLPDCKRHDRCTRAMHLSLQRHPNPATDGVTPTLFKLILFFPNSFPTQKQATSNLKSQGFRISIK